MSGISNMIVCILLALTTCNALPAIAPDASSAAAAAAATQEATAAVADQSVAGSSLQAAVSVVVAEHAASTGYVRNNGGGGLAHDASSVQANEIGIGGPVVHTVVQTPVEKYPLETEGIPSRILTVYEKTQTKTGTFVNTLHAILLRIFQSIFPPYQPLPIVDTIQEHEKYGNTGDKFLPIGRAIVNTYEGFSNLLNRLLDAPVEIAKQVSRGLTGKLNTVGGALVGL